MWRDREMEHPEIGVYARTGYPSRRQVTLELSDDVLRRFMTENLQAVLDEVLADGRFMDRFVMNWQEEMEDWCQDVLGEV